MVDRKDKRAVIVVFWVFCLHVVVFTTVFSQDVVATKPNDFPVEIYTAKEILTLDKDNSVVEAVAVQGDRVIATGSLPEVKAAMGDSTYSVVDTFKDKVIVPGFIAQHDHPLLAGVSMTSEIIAIEDWHLPGKTYPAAKSHSEYISRLKNAESKMQDPDEVLLSWGYHQYFHGPLKKAELDAISSTRPIIIWHRSAHEFYLNSAAEKRFGVTREWYESLSESAKAQSDFENGHYWEQGWFAVGPLLLGELFRPDRVISALQFVQDYFHANGVTTGAEPGGLVSKPLQDLQNTVLGQPDSPFRFYFIADGKSITGQYKDDEVVAETEKLLDWGSGMTAFLPGQVKLFADGAIYSQAMQLKKPYTDGHSGAWMMDLDFFSRSFRLYWDAGYQIHVHVNGDEGLEMVLDTLQENMQRNPRTDHRTVIVHFAVSDKKQVERIKRLGAIVSANPYYPVALADNYRVHGLGPERADSMVRLGDVEKAGISYSLHSDMPMAPGQPLFLIWSAVNRVTNEGNLRAPEQRASRLGALKAVTKEAAYSLQLEDEIGSIEPGKLANFTVLQENPLTVDPMNIKDIEVWGTVLEGRVQPVEL
ncbi:MAG: amidohydrolase [Halioglobus sp.]|nr:amidohydrolase [Halioglobus sp.]